MENTTNITQMMSTDVIGALYEAFGRGDLAGLLELVDPEVDWSVQVEAPGAELVPMFRNGRGHEAVQRYFAGVADLEIHAFDVRRMHGDPSSDEVLVELTIDFHHRGTGKGGRFDEIHHFVVRDGRVVRYRPFLDTATYIETHRP